MRIGIDIDNTICNTTECVLEYINQKIGTNLTISDITEYSIEKFVPKHKEVVTLAFHDKEMWKNVTLLPDVKKYVDKLIDDGHEIYFITATTFANIDKKSSFIRRNFPNINVDDRLINIRHKQLLNLDILVDDYLENLIHDRTYYSVVMDCPWNRIDDAAYIPQVPCFTRAHNWQEVYDKINMIDELLKENE